MAFDISHFGLSEETLPRGWRKDRLDAIADINPDQIDKDYFHDFIEYLDISNVGKGVIGKPEFLPLKNAPSRAKRIVATNDTILSTVRPGNRAYAFLKEVPPNLIVSTGFAVLRAKNSVERFLYYLSTSDPIIDYLASIAEEKTAYPSVNPGDIGECIIPIPTIPEQRAMAQILGTLDDKIELNRQMNETLEAMAQALFKSWFVDFDPVRAKAEGKMTKEQICSAYLIPPAAFDLFPSRFQSSLLGEIPEGWSVGTLGDVAENSRATVQPNEIASLTPYIALEHMPRRCIALYEWEYADQLESNKFTFKRGEILFGKLRPYFHKVGVAPLDGVCSTDILVIRPKEPQWFGFVLGHISSVELVNYADAASTGTKMPRTNWQDIAAYEVALPSTQIVAVFTEIVRSLIEQIIANIHESRTLGTLRDTLLPKLLLGEISTVVTN